MVLKILGVAVNALLPSKYYVHAFISLITIVVVHAFAQGRATNRERDMHGRVVLVTGGFTPLGLTLIQSLAERGAHIIALSPKPVEDPEVDILITLLRSTSKNEQIFSEECDLASPVSVRSFCTRFLTSKETRLDAIVFAHEYQHIGSFLSRSPPEELAKHRQVMSLATFLIVTLMLPVLLVAPVERDIRIINVVNPFYAAASTAYSSTEVPSSNTPMFQQEGWRSLQMAIFTRHLQRVLDALPSGGQVPKTDQSTIRVVSDKVQKSNIVAVSVCPGISRADTIAPLFLAGGTQRRSRLGLIIYIVIQPLLRLITKSQTSAVQSVLHVLFLPTPFKRVPQASTSAQSPLDAVTPEEVLKPGALYRECAVMSLRIPKLDGEDKRDMPMTDDGELGGVHLGQSVWELLEVRLKEWEKAVPSSDQRGAGNATPTVGVGKT